MKGFSVFLGKEPGESFEEYLTMMYQAGFTGIFTSLHIPEEDSSLYKSRLLRLGTWAKEHEVSLYADISGEALEEMHLSFSDTDELKALGLTGLRMDYGIELSVIADVSRRMKVALNASTMTEETLHQLRTAGAKMNHLIAWHNYYPRPETGLAKREFSKKNLWLKTEGLKVAAFVPGDGELRGPLYKQLPTLEKHRGSHPLADLLELETECNVDDVYIGDPSLDAKTLAQFTLFEEEECILLYAETLDSSQGNVEGAHTNRPDGARDVFRSSEARMQHSGHVSPKNTVTRKKGSITLDNHLYGRYQGELQITQTDLPKDEKVNVVGQIRRKDLPLLDRLGSGQKIRIQLLKDNKHPTREA